MAATSGAARHEYGDASGLAPAATAAAAVQPPSIEADHISASYHVKIDNDNLRDDLRRLFRRADSGGRLIPALRDVSFDVQKGSVLAVIGRNGAGKSTLCRVILGTLPPDEGRVVVRGRMNMLAPGLGFSEALTGRENITLGGLANGLSPARLAEITEEIGEFSQLSSYLDLPMRSYSSGMRMRLSSSIAVFLDPEILLIDEALTGGDAAFTEHIAERTAQLTGEGRTIVIVSHGLQSVKSMATEVLWLHQGRVAEFGDPDDVVAKYMRYCRIESLNLSDV
ncbi:MAG: ABC transporter ATP-binding protein [Acidimicrobiia bacterium]|nr:ABC transporter ATP-binding protein [Acidimicrobiia bacterium]